MFIQLDLDEMFGGDEEASCIRSKQPSQFSEDASAAKLVPERKQLHYQLNSSELFKASSTGSGQVASAIDSFPSAATDPPSQFEMPGERLYYQYQHNLMRKMKEQERFKYELSQQEKHQMTFTPHINKNTNKILAYRQENPQTASRALERKQQKLKELEYLEKQKNFEEEKECTFKPKIAKKYILEQHRTQEITRNRNDNVFNNLYREGHRRDIRLMVKKGDQPQADKVPNAPQLVQEFLQRNDQFIQKTQKKLKMLEEEASQYDLRSGEKLFTPKISKPNGRIEHSRSGAIFSKHMSLHDLNSKLREKVGHTKESRPREQSPHEQELGEDDVPESPLPVQNFYRKQQLSEGRPDSPENMLPEPLQTHKEPTDEAQPAPQAVNLEACFESAD